MATRETATRWNEALLPEAADAGERVPRPAEPREIRLADGTLQDLSRMTPSELQRLDWEQERIFARRIRDSAKGSAERAAAFRDGYDVVCAILEVLRRDGDAGLVMGMQDKYCRLVVRLLERQRRRVGGRPFLFEIGYGTGALLRHVRERGFDCGGIEVSTLMAERARRDLGPERQADLLVGEPLTTDLSHFEARCSVVYSNDVFEHFHPDEALDYLRLARRLLAPGGLLVTITPNWHRRPADVTRYFAPPRTPAQGLHLKEYTLREISALLARAGFRRISTPLLVTKKRVVLAGSGLAASKRVFEPVLEYLPYALTSRLCGCLGLSYTLAEN